MKVLITNIWLVNHAGTEVYVRDLAIALKKRGISVAVYSPELGETAAEIREAGIQVVNDPKLISLVPDIIHAHHNVPALEAIAQFGDVPVIYYVHDRMHPADKPPKHSRIIQYLATDLNTLDRLVTDEGIPEKFTGVLNNWVDTEKFKLRNEWSVTPRRALVFSNYATADNYCKTIQNACNTIGLRLDCIGMGVRRPVKYPEAILGNYDIVFGKAKAAMEAMATGAMVIPCDFKGLGEAVSTKNFAHMRAYNFGMKILNRPVETGSLIEEIKKYDPEECKKTAALIRKDADFSSYIDKLLLNYQETMSRYQKRIRIFDPFNREFSEYNDQRNNEEKNNEDFQTAHELLVIKNREIEVLKDNIVCLKKEIKRLNISFKRRALQWLKKKINEI